MNTTDRASRLNSQVYQEASEWLVLMRTGADTGSREQLDAWLRRSPEHVRAYLEVSEIWEDAAELDPGKTLSAEDHIARARSETNVIPIDPEPPHQSEPGRTARRKYPYVGLAASVLLAVLGGWFYSQKGVYTTDIGEQRSITLSDGSVVDLNARSRLRVIFSARERAIDLVEGQALFHVARDTSRPFIVHTGITSVRAVGTEFDVYRKDVGTIVTVLEGRVAVSSASSPVPESRSESPELLLAAGDQVVVTEKATRKQQRPDIAAATAWTGHRLIFNSAPLSEVVEEFNRYNPRRLVIESPELREFAVIGVFSSADPSSLLRFLQTQPDILVTETESQVRIAKRPGSTSP